MDEQDPLLEAVTALHAHFVGDASVPDTLVRVSEVARRQLAVAQHVGVTLVVDGTPGTYAFTDPEIPEVDQAQYRTGDGPCMTAYELGTSVVVPATRRSSEFTEFCATAAQHGILSVASFPLTTGDQRIGAMNHYALREDAFGPREVALGERFAEHAAYLLVNAQAYWDARSLSENLEAAMRSRAQIEQAKGILMARTGCGPERAFDLLRQQSQLENRKLREVAEELVRQADQANRPSPPS